MATFTDIAVSAGFNILFVFLFFLAFAVLRLQPLNDRVYFPKWYLRGIRCTPTHSGHVASRFVNLNVRTYFRFLNWMPAAIKMPQLELIDHAGLDSAVYVRIYLLGYVIFWFLFLFLYLFYPLIYNSFHRFCRLKIFVPIFAVASCVLIPINLTGKALSSKDDITFSEIDKFSISNIALGSHRLVLMFSVSFLPQKNHPIHHLSSGSGPIWQWLMFSHFGRYLYSTKNTR